MGNQRKWDVINQAIIFVQNQKTQAVLITSA